MLKVEVRSAECRERVSQKGNTLRLQKMALVDGDEFPVVFEQFVERPFPPGMYEFKPEFRTDRFGGLELHPFEFHLVPLK